MLFSLEEPNSKEIFRYRLFIEEYDYAIIHKPGKCNTNADAFSRVEINPINLPNENVELRDVLDGLDEHEVQRILNETTEVDVRSMVAELESAAENDEMDVDRPSIFKNNKETEQSEHSELESIHSTHSENIHLSEQPMYKFKRQIILKPSRGKKNILRK